MNLIASAAVSRSVRPVLIGLAALCFTTVCQGQDWAKAKLEKSSRHGEYVTIQEPGGRALQAWVVYPEVKAKAPVVVLIHEIFGESDWFRLMADELAAKGYIAIAPDLLSGFGPPPAAGAPMAGMGADDHAHMAAANTGAGFVRLSPGGTSAFPDQGAVVKAVTTLDAAGVTADLDAAADYGKKLPASNGKVAVAGFCWGGGKSFLFATHRHDLGAAFVFYGPGPSVDKIAAITAPVYGFYAGNDARIGATVPQTTTDMKGAGKVYEPVTYEGAGHGFMRAGQAPEAKEADKKAFDEGFERMLKVLKGMK